jgi:nicotinamidase/pyrazinamidase
VTGIDHIVRKGVDGEIDSYSAFFDNAHRRDTGLADFLRSRDVGRVVVVGLATDYCILFTALDGREVGFDVVVVTDGVRGVNLQPFDDERAFEKMREAGCALVESASV